MMTLGSILIERIKDMKKIKRISILSVLLLTLVLYSSITALAEPERGVIQIEDATGGVGGEMYVNITMTSGGSPIGDTALTMTFDPYVVEFVRGTNATAEWGTVTVMATGDGVETSLDYYVVFRGLVEGTTHLTMFSFMTWTYDGAALYADFNQGTITVGPEGTEGTGPGGGAAGGADFDGAPTGDSAEFPIQNVMFTIFDHFSDGMIPPGFVREQIDVRGSNHNGIRHLASDQFFMFMQTAGQDPILAIYHRDRAEFDAAELIDKGGERFVIVIDHTLPIPVPAGFNQTSETFNGTQITVWQNQEMPEFLLVYALNSVGHMGWFQYDTLDGSFQRFMAPLVEADEEEEEDAEEPTDLLGRIVGIMQDNMMIGLIAVLAVIFILLIIVIVLAVKVQRRNNELDELYADGQGSYGDDDYDDDYDDDDFEDEYDDEYDDDYEYEDDRYHDDGYEDEVGFDNDEYEVGYDDDDYDDDDYDDEDDERRDDFNIDFVDL